MFTSLATMVFYESNSNANKLAEEMNWFEECSVLENTCAYSFLLLQYTNAF